MPFAGGVGAITAGNRAAKSRRGTTMSKPAFGSKSSLSSTTPKHAVTDKTSDISEAASCDSKPSVMTMLKNQVQETSGFLKKKQQALLETGAFFKKQQQAFSDKVQRGLGMSASKKDTLATEVQQKKDQADENMEPKCANVVLAPTSPQAISTPALPPMPAMSAVRSAKLESVAAAKQRPAQWQRPATETPQPWSANNLSASTFMSLQQMGFPSDAIHQATTMLGPDSSFEALFDVLLAIGTPLSPPNSGNAVSSTDPAPGIGKPSLVPFASNVEQASSMDLDTAAAFVADMVEQELACLDQETHHPSQRDAEPEIVLQAGSPESPSFCTWVESAKEEADAFTVNQGADEASCRTIAAVVVASAIAKAAKILSLQVTSTTTKKVMAEGHFTPSPVKGGA